MSIHTGKTTQGQKLLRGCWRGFVDLVAPNRCSLCRNIGYQGDDPWLCPLCVANLPQVTTENISPHYTFGWFSNGLRELIHLYKYENQRQLAATLATLVLSRQPLQDLVSQADLIIAVPMHPWKLRLKGFNPAHELAKQLARRLDKPLSSTHLLKTRLTTSQTTLSRQERRANLQQTLHAAPLSLPKNCRLLLVDDVVTTGATLQCCSEALLSVHPTCKIDTLTVAATQYVSICPAQPPCAS